jgi:hypothetical protein
LKANKFATEVGASEEMLERLRPPESNGSLINQPLNEKICATSRCLSTIRRLEAFIAFLSELASLEAASQGASRASSEGSVSGATEKLAGDQEQMTKGKTLEKNAATSLAAVLHERHDKFPPLHFPILPRHPLTHQRRRELVALKLVPHCILSHDRHEAWAFRQSQDLPQSVVQLRSVHGVPVRTP